MTNIIKRIKNFSITTALLLVFVAAPLVSASNVAAAAVDPFKSCSTNSQSEICKANSAGGGLFGAGSIWENVLQTLIYIVGAVSVIMIVIGGLRYSISNGDQAQVTSAKNTILYALVGICVAVSAQAIVSFVFGRVLA